MNDLISIIIPIYNVEKYVGRCIESVINQTYKNIEIILIDDGSTDSSKIICQKYTKEDSRIHYYFKKNGGVSLARNMGIEKSNGKFIQFVDADDYIEKNMVEVLYNNIIKYNADISTCNIKKMDKNGKILFPIQHLGIHTYTKDEYIKNIYDEKMYYAYPINKLIKKEIIGNIRFDEQVFNMEDILFILEITQNVKLVVYDGNEYLYNYVFRPDSASRKKYDEKNLSILRPMNIIIDKYLNLFSENLKDDFILGYYLESLKAYYYSKKTNNFLEYRDKLKLVKKQYYKYLLSSKYINNKSKLKLILANASPFIYYSLKYDLIKYKR